MPSIVGLQLIGALALGLALVYLGARLDRKRRPTRKRAADAGTTVSSGDGSSDTTSSGAVLPWLGSGQNSKSDSNEPGGSGDFGWAGDSGGDGGGGGGGD